MAGKNTTVSNEQELLKIHKSLSKAWWIFATVCLKALSLIHGHKRESSAKKKRVCLTWGGQIRVPS